MSGPGGPGELRNPIQENGDSFIFSPPDRDWWLRPAKTFPTEVLAVKPPPFEPLQWVAPAHDNVQPIFAAVNAREAPLPPGIGRLISRVLPTGIREGDYAIYFYGDPNTAYYAADFQPFGIWEKTVAAAGSCFIEPENQQVH